MEIFDSKQTVVEAGYDHIDLYLWKIAKFDLIEII